MMIWGWGHPPPGLPPASPWLRAAHPRIAPALSGKQGQIAVIPLQAAATMAATDRLMREALNLFDGLTVKDV